MLKNYTNLVLVETQADGVAVYTATYTYKDSYTEQRTIFVKNNKVISWYT